MIVGFEGLIFVRLVHEWRKVCRPDGPIRSKLFFVASALAVPGFSLFGWQTCKTMFKHAAQSGEGAALFIPVTLGSTLAYCLFLLPELIREIGLAEDLELMRVAPVSAEQCIAYRLFVALLRMAGFGSFVAAFPVCCAWTTSRDTFQFVLFLCLVIACFACGSVLALWTSASMLCVSGRLGMRRQALLALVSIALVAGTVLATLKFFNGAALAGLVQESAGSAPAGHLVAALLLLMVLSGYPAYRHTVRLWPGASKPGRDAISHSAALLRTEGPFSLNRSRAIFQKDVKEHCRNPDYRYSLLVCVLLMLYVAAANCIHVSGATTHSWARLMVGFSYIYLIPFLFSARTVSMEFPMLQFYRLVFPEPGQLLDQKWRSQSVSNCFIALILALPLLFLFSGGATLDPVYYVSCVILLVPLFTMLALALGTFFASTSVPPNVFGIRLPGGVIYFLLTIVMYSFLLNRMILGAVWYSLFLIPLTALLYFLARRTLSRFPEHASS